MQFSGHSRKHHTTNNFTVLQTLLQADSLSGSRNSWRIRTLWRTMSQLLILSSSLRTQSHIQSLTHSRTYPSIHSSFHPTLLLIFSWPKLIYAALRQLPSSYRSNLNFGSAALSADSKQRRTRIKQMTHARRCNAASTCTVIGSACLGV
jgi:hypothetical protein